MKEKKKKEMTKKVSGKRTSKNKIKVNPRILIIIFAVIIVIGIGILSYVLLKNMEYKKYAKYEEEMNAYGYNELYNNQSAKTSEKVTTSEAIKMMISVCLNQNDISGIAKAPTNDYENAIWVLYAQDKNLVNASEVNKDTANKKVKYIDVIKYFARGKKILLNQDLTTDESKSVKDIEKYSAVEQEAIMDMLANGILEIVGDNKLKANRKIFKGQLNEIVINYINKYHTVVDNSEILQTDESQKPSNADKYPYIVKDVAKEVYEMPFIVDTESRFKNPKTTFQEYKEHYHQITEKIEKYYHTIFNVNYNNITLEDMKKNLAQLTLMGADENALKEYVDYVKANHIVIEGKVKVQEPIIYFDGYTNRARTKIEFKVVSADTDENLLFIDFINGKNTKYHKKEFATYIDAKFGSAYDTSTYYLKSETLLSLLTNSSEDIGIGLKNVPKSPETTENKEQ